MTHFLHILNQKLLLFAQKPGAQTLPAISANNFHIGNLGMYFILFAQIPTVVFKIQNTIRCK